MEPNKDLIASLNKLVELPTETSYQHNLSLSALAQIKAFEISINKASSEDLDAIKEIAKMLFKHYHVKDTVFKEMLKSKWNL